MRRRLLLAAPALLLARPALAITWRGVPAQGALVRGQAAPGTRLALDGRAVRVAPQGHFALGFGRDHDASASLSITHPEGRRETRRLPVEKRDWDVQRIAGLPPAMVTPGEAALRRITDERARLAAARGLDAAGTGFTAEMAWPARGRISGVYGSQRILNGQPRQPHYGLDVAAPTGTPVAAALPGRVSLSGDFYFFGQLLVLDHGHGVNTLYAHLSERLAREGQVVAQGERIGLIGATGRVTGPHLHFSLSWYQTFLDPQPLLPREQG
ncbi:M23 family metallopeptidase [Falsiroseomonas selenitidurans]|nr:M23 family metallopeptidase [Falsiroseomonas selenitidurans]